MPAGSFDKRSPTAAPPGAAAPPERELWSLLRLCLQLSGTAALAAALVELALASGLGIPPRAWPTLLVAALATVVLVAIPFAALVWRHFRGVRAEAETARQALHRLEAKRDLLQRLVHSAALLEATDRDGVISFVNGTFSRVSGYSPADIVDHDHSRLCSGKHPREFWRDMYETVHAGRLWRGEICNLDRDGLPYWVDTFVMADLDERQKPLGYLSLGFDTTRRRRSELLAEGMMQAATTRDSQQFLRRTLEAVEAGLAVSGVGVITCTALQPRAVVLAARSEGHEFTGAEFELAAELREQVLHDGQPLLRESNARELLACCPALGRDAESLLSLPLKDAEGAPLGLLLVVDRRVRHDFADLLPTVAGSAARIGAELGRHRLSNRLLELSRAVESSADAFVILDRGGCITRTNHSFTYLTGCDPDEAPGRPLDTFARPDFAAALREGLESSRRGGRSWQGRASFTRLATADEPGEFIAAVTISPVFDEAGLFSGHAAVIRDVTTEVEQERLLREKTETLTATNVDLARARDVAEAASRARAEFLAAMGHEIRTPLNGVLGMLGFMLDTELSAEQRDFVETARQSGESLLGILNDVLDHTEIQSGRFALEAVPFDPRAAIEDVLDLHMPGAVQKGLALVLDCPPHLPSRVSGDAAALRQVVSKLVHNAIKFTDSGLVSVRVLERESAPGELALTICVQDTGIGIPLEQQPHLFESFRQAENGMTRRFGGTGLGLAIARGICDLMRGHLRVESAPGLGTEFRFEVAFPVVPVESVARPGSISLEGLRALVVDDQPVLRRVIERQLEMLGMRVAVAGNGREALATLAEASVARDPFAVAIVDYLMPEMSGVEFARVVSTSAEWSGVALVALTGEGSRGNATMFLDAGFEAVLAKPVRPSLLDDAVRNVLGARATGGLVPLESRRSPAGPGARSGPDASVGFGRRVLLVEDNAINQKVATRILERLGCDVVVANDGREAVEAFRLGPFDLIVMDCQMPVMDGFEATRRIRQDERGRRRTPIVALTANASPADRERCLACGMDDFHAKPVRQEDLQASLVKFTRGREPAVRAAA